MIDKVKKYREIYYEKEPYKAKEKENGNFIITTNNGITKPTARFIDFIDKNECLERIEDVFLIKVGQDEDFFYNIYFKYKDVKFKLILLGSSYTYRMKTSDSWKRVMLKGVLEHNGINQNDFNSLLKEIIENVKSNTQERIKYLLNKQENGKYLR